MQVAAKPSISGLLGPSAASLRREWRYSRARVMVRQGGRERAVRESGFARLDFSKISCLCHIVRWCLRSQSGGVGDTARVLRKELKSAPAAQVGLFATLEQQGRLHRFQPPHTRVETIMVIGIGLCCVV